MSSRASLNKVLLIGNLTRDPELRYTPSGAAVCTFSVATNRSYTASDGTKKEEVEFIRIVAWGKLGELCSQLLKEGRKVYVEGRMQTRSWETPDGQNRQTTEVVMDDMRILDSKRDFEGDDHGSSYNPPKSNDLVDASDLPEVVEESKPEKPAVKSADKNEDQPKEEKPQKSSGDDKVDLDDLPF